MIKIIQGGRHEDDRGILSFVNEFNFDDIVRFYTIENKDINVKRGWQGHKKECKYFYCVKGSFDIALVQIDYWQQPSKNLIPKRITLQNNKSEILMVPGGYANAITALEEQSKLIVFSNYTLEESIKDSFRFNSNLW